MATHIFNTLQYAKSLENAGYTRKQAEAVSECMVHFQPCNEFATKAEMYGIRDELRHSISELKNRLLHKLTYRLIGVMGFYFTVFMGIFTLMR